MDVVNAVLAQKLGLAPREPDPAAEPEAATPMRQMRRALGRAADTAVGLSASVLGIAEEDMEAETLIDSGPDGWVVIGLRDGDNAGLTGLFLIDPALRSALVEMQTMGSLLPAASDERKVTRTDAVLSLPFATELLMELDSVGFGDGTLTPARYDMGPIDNLRTAGLVMMQGLYRSWRISVQVGGGDRQGEILIAMQPKVTAVPQTGDANANWSAALRGALEQAPTDLDAVLTRMPMSMKKIEDFEVGQVLHLAGTTVGSVMLIGSDGKQVATARLGQVAGKRAVRVEEDVIELQEAPPLQPTAIAPQIDIEAPQMAVEASGITDDSVPLAEPMMSVDI